MVTFHKYNILLVALLTVGHSISTNGDAGGKVEKRGTCKGVTCREAPKSAGICKKVPGQMSECCQDFECATSDGVHSRHSGMTSSQSSGYDKVSPDGTHMQGFSSSSFSSSSSGSSGPGGAMRPIGFGDFKPLSGLPLSGLGDLGSLPPLPPLPGFKPMEGMPPFPSLPPLGPLKPLGLGKK
ncbi:RNA-binding protein 12 [Folsomia candida]|uniref:RNA-binding protein 12 n=1 Tax=Folsomia candida TaxID=158441 RepID=UPI000B8F8907|nr:RNA-binding protein 12 [Folsomia candida]